MVANSKVLLVGSLVLGSAAVISELLHQRKEGEPLRQALSNVKHSEPERIEAGLTTILQLLDEDKQNDLGTKNRVIDSLDVITPIIASKDSIRKYSKHILSLALKLIQKCSDEPEGRQKAAQNGVVEGLLRIFSELTCERRETAADIKIIDDVAATLAAITTVDPKQVVLDDDVPSGSECALRLIRSKNLGAFLDMLAFDVRSATYLQCLTRCFVNLSHLDEGIKRFRNVQAVDKFILLLQRPIVEVKENALTIIRNLVKKDSAARTQVLLTSPAEKLATFLGSQHHKHTKIMENTLHILGDLLYRSTEQEKVKFGQEMIQADLFDSLAALLGKDLPKQTRGLAEEVLTLAFEVKEIEEAVKSALQSNASAIQRRKRQDQEEVRRKAMEQQKQNQFMEMMAMREMMGGDVSPEDLQAMMAMGGGGMPFGM